VSRLDRAATADAADAGHFTVGHRLREAQEERPGLV